MSAKRWIGETNAIGLQARTGRYGGTFAHEDIALEFATWISARFKLLVIKDYRRLKAEEARRNSLEWSVRRELSKVNYALHTDAVKRHLIPPRINPKQIGFIYANEADLLNLALFGMTAKQWRERNPEMKGNIRDHASALQLLILANMETLNAEFIAQGIPPDERLQRLNDIAIYQVGLLAETPAAKRLKPPKGE